MSTLLDAGHRINRERLASELADILDAAGCDAATADGLDEIVWSMAGAVLAQRRGRPVASPSVETRRLAVFALRQRESAADPFDGLPS